MTIPRLLQMEEYWGNHPPVHQMLAAFFGIEKKRTVSDVAAIEDSGAAFLRDFIAVGGTIPPELQGELINVG